MDSFWNRLSFYVMDNIGVTIFIHVVFISIAYGLLLVIRGNAAEENYNRMIAPFRRRIPPSIPDKDTYIRSQKAMAKIGLIVIFAVYIAWLYSALARP